MREKFRQQLEEMYHQMVVMGGLCQQAIAVAVKTLEEEEDTAENLEAQVFALDGEIDDMEREIEALCTKLLLRQQPVAKDLRRSVITTKRAYEELEKGGYVYTVPAKGSYVAQQSTQLVREAYLTQIEEHIQEILSLAAACGLGEEEVLDLFRLLWRDQDTEKGDTL